MPAQKPKTPNNGTRTATPNQPHPRARSAKNNLNPGLIPAQTHIHANHLALDFPCNMQKKPPRSASAIAVAQQRGDSMSISVKLPAISVVASIACATLALAAALPAPAHAATPITVTSQAATDGPIRYTVKVTSKQFGNSQETRTIRSGESDDFTW